MKAYTIINSGLEKVAGKETEELLNYKIKVKPSVIELDVSPQELVNYSFKVQSARRVLVALGECKDLDSFQFLENLQDLRYTIKVEGVKGQNNRQKIAKQLGKIITAKKEIKFDYKNPDVIIVVFFNGESYFIGLDVMGTELDQRHYRVFPHSASFKGDFAYFFLRKSGFVKGNSFLMDFCKDGSIPIEAAIYESGSLVQDLDETYSFEKIDLFKGCQKPIFIKNDVNNIIAVDETMQNTNAARKNAKLANVNVDIRKYDLDELDVKFDENQFDVLMFHVTTKDESRLNEIYYQASYVLKQKGRLMLIGREHWEFSISDKFRLLETEDIIKGDSIHRFWVLELK